MAISLIAPLPYSSSASPASLLFPVKIEGAGPVMSSVAWTEAAPVRLMLLVFTRPAALTMVGALRVLLPIVSVP